MDEGGNMQTVDYDTLIYTDLRQYLLRLVGGNVVRGRQNNAPFPEDVTMMQFLRDETLSQDYDDDGNVSHLITRCIQLDFFGVNANAKGRQVATMWKTPYTGRELTKCVPLYCDTLKSVPFINEKGIYEERAILEIYLQFTVHYAYNVDQANVYIKDIVKWP